MAMQYYKKDSHQNPIEISEAVVSEYMEIDSPGPFLELVNQGHIVGMDWDEIEADLQKLRAVIVALPDH